MGRGRGRPRGDPRARVQRLSRRVIRRELVFGLIAAALLVVYGWGWSVVGPIVAAPATSPTARPTRPAEQTGVPRVPGAIAFALRGDVYVLRDGRYAPLTSEGRNAQPALSGDGGTLYFVRKEEIDGRRVVDGAVVNAELGFTRIVRKPSIGGTEEIVLDGLRQKRADGEHVVAWLLGPALSPDGRRIAVVEDDGDGAADLVVTTFGATAAQRATTAVLSRGAELADAAWSPDGKSIAVTTYDAGVPGLILWSADRAGQAQRVATLPEGEAYRPSWSPDGRWLVYTLRRDGRNDVHAYEVATKRDVALTSDGRSWNGVLSPDGEWLAFLRERSGTIDLYAMQLGEALSGGAPKEALKLTRGEGIDGSSRPSWSR